MADQHARRGAAWVRRWARIEVRFWCSVAAAAPGHSMLALALIAIRSVGVWVAVFGSGHLVQALATGSDAAWRWLALTAVGLVAEPLAGAWQDAVVAAIQQRYSAQQIVRVADAANCPHGIAHLEDSATRVRFADIEEYQRGMFGLAAMEGSWNVLAYAAIGIAGFVAIGRWSWWGAVAVLLIYRLLRVVWTAYLDVVLTDLVDSSNEGRRRADYLRSLPLERGAGKEIRLFGLTPWVVSHYRQVWAQSFEAILRRRTEAARPAVAAAFLSVVVLGGVIAWVGSSAWNGSVSLATLVIALQGFVQLAGLGPLGDYNVQATRARFYDNEVRGLTATVAGAGRPAQQSHEPGTVAPGRACSVDLSEVTFSYPSRDEPVFTGLDLHIPAGQSVAIVGVNGVGKSTLIKLLCGLYPPQTGTVRVGGGDPFTDERARRRVATIFQDFVRYPLTLLDNVALPLRALGVDRSQAQAAAERSLRAAAGSDVLERLDDDWSVTLDPGFAGGTDLSGGQWQRLALARALAAVEAGAGVLVLDEPTAALDVRAEAEIFSRFLQVTRAVTTILVSHRLSSVRHADRIVVLGPAGVVEDGSHDELLATGGEYAQMFTLQAARFERAGGDRSKEH